MGRALDRRHFLKIIGGGVVVSAAALGGFAATRTPHKALAPWDRAGQYLDPRVKALSFAILAPNPHNRQPWKVDLSGGGQTVAIYRDRSLNLPHTDPMDRQLTIGMGCFIELFTLAAAYFGYSTAAHYFPDGESGPVAVVRMQADPGVKREAIFQFVLDRRSCKEPFRDEAPTADQAKSLSALGEVVLDPERVEALRQITLAAFEVEYRTPRTLQESLDLMRIGRSEIEASPDGIDLGGAFLETLNLTGVLTRETMADPGSSAWQQGLDMYRKMLLATPSYLMVKTSGNSRLDQIGAGRNWVRLNLTATGLGLSLHPVSQALQEFAEMEPHYRQIHREFADSGQTIQMLGRLGYGPEVSPRRAGPSIVGEPRNRQTPTSRPT